MEIAKQLAVFLDNRPGALARVCEAFSEAGINIHALSTSDTVDHSVVRMVVDNTQSAIWLLEENGAMVVEDEVLLIDNTNKPGELAKLARALGKAGLILNIFTAPLPPNRARAFSFCALMTQPRLLRLSKMPDGSR